MAMLSPNSHKKGWVLKWMWKLFEGLLHSNSKTSPCKYTGNITSDCTQVIYYTSTSLTWLLVEVIDTFCCCWIVFGCTYVCQMSECDVKSIMLSIVWACFLLQPQLHLQLFLDYWTIVSTIVVLFLKLNIRLSDFNFTRDDSEKWWPTRFCV